MPPDSPTPKSYLDYLDKEMNIMGILSAFCVLTVAGVTTGLKDATWTGSSATALVLIYGSRYVLAGCGCVIVAALEFYRQRSLLAWYYGQICLAEFGAVNEGSVKEWLKSADGWDTWIDYRAAFGALSAGFLEFFLATCTLKWNQMSDWWILVAMPPFLAAIHWFVAWRVLTTHNDAENPFQKYFHFGVTWIPRWRRRG